MNQNDQLYYCKQCLNRGFDPPNQGVVCNLTNAKATFKEDCESFKVDPAIQRSNTVNDAHIQAEYSKDAIAYLPQALKDKLYKEQNYKLGLIAGLTAALIGASVWAGIAVVSGYNLSIVAIGIGLFIGFTLRFTGKGIDEKFGFTGGALTLFSILLGDYLSIIFTITNEFDISLIDVIFGGNFGVILDIFIENLSFLSVIFWSLGIAEGYKFAFRVIPHYKIEEMMKEKAPKSEELLDTDT